MKYRFLISLFIILSANHLQPTCAIQVDDRTSSKQSPAKVELHFRVTVPDDTLGDAEIYLSGNHLLLGNWKPNHLKLARHDDGSYQTRIEIESGSKIEFKVTQGSWQTVEKKANGRDIANRVYEVQADTPKQTVSVTVDSWAKPSRPASTVVGNLKTHDRFASKILMNERTIQVWLPKDYDSTTARYPVLYMHDGQNLFDAAQAAFGTEWQVDETVSRLIDEQKIPSIIVVGIANTARRVDEYTHHRDETFDAGGDGANYLRFLVEEVKPFIDDNYRTQPDRNSTGIMGSSLGGLVSLHACLTQLETFSKFGVVSPSLGWAREASLGDAQQIKLRAGDRIWLSMGELEGGSAESQKSNIERAVRLQNILLDCKLQPDIDFRFLRIPAGKHNEATWAASLPDALTYLFSQQNASHEKR